MGAGSKYGTQLYLLIQSADDEMRLLQASDRFLLAPCRAHVPYQGHRHRRHDSKAGDARKSFTFSLHSGSPLASSYNNDGGRKSQATFPCTPCNKTSGDEEAWKPGEQGEQRIGPPVNLRRAQQLPPRNSWLMPSVLSSQVIFSPRQCICSEGHHPRLKSLLPPSQ